MNANDPKSQYNLLKREVVVKSAPRDGFGFLSRQAIDAFVPNCILAGSLRVERALRRTPEQMRAGARGELDLIVASLPNLNKRARERAFHP